MAVVEAEHERLEAYLDGELSPAEARALEVQCEHDAELVGELEQLRAARQARAGVWQALQGSDAEVERVQVRLERALARRQVWGRRAMGLRWFAAAAASVLIGVGLGWSGRQVMDDPRGAPGGAMNNRVATAPDIAAGDGFRVALTDEAGQVMAVQRFESLDSARQFTSDLRQWQQRREQVRDGNIILVGDRF